VVPHYTQTCGADCPHHQQDDVEPEHPSTSTSTATSTSTKAYLNTTAHGVQITALRALVERMKQTARYFIHGYNTCNVETHRRVLAKLAELPAWSLDIEAGNQYMAAMDRQRAYHSARKSAPEYNQQQKRLACEQGQRRAAHDRASNNRGHDYQHTPPLYVVDEDGDEVKQKRKARRSKEQIEKDKAEEDAEKRRLTALFDCGDTTFTTLGVIDVNLQPKGTKGRKKGKRDEEEEEEEEERGKKQRGKDEKVSETGTADKENSDPSLPSVPRKRQRRVERTEVGRKGRSAERTPTMAVVVTDVAVASRQSAASAPVSCVQPVAARAITFR
jgi:hypothetical protein